MQPAVEFTASVRARVSAWLVQMAWPLTAIVRYVLRFG